MADDKDRYMTLLGNDIQEDVLVSFLKDDGLKASGLSAAFLAVSENAHASSPEEALDAVAFCFLNNVADLLFARIFLEKWFLNKLNTEDVLLHKETLQNLSIDTKPDPKKAVTSVAKYGVGISKAKLFYAGFLAIFLGTLSGASVVKALSSGDMNGMMRAWANSASNLTRMYKGFHRFNKLAKGEWAIVNTPPKKPVEAKVKEGNLAYIPT